jgi:hypothetical protein
MLKRCGFVVVVGLLTALGGGNAFGLSFFDADITPDAIFGSGNDNGFWTVDQNNGIELGLRGKLRYPAENIFNSNGDGTYSFNPGTPGGAPAGNGEWAFEWSINTDYLGTSDNVLNDFVYQIRIDYDPGIGTNYQTFDLINDGTYWDHSIGDNSTGNGAGIEAPDGDDSTYATYISTYNVAQNSWRMTFFDDGSHAFNPGADGTYDFELIAYDPDDNTVLASTSMQIIVGAGAPVPEPASLALLGIGIAGLAGARLRKRRS